MYPYLVDLSNQTDLYQLNDDRFQLPKNGTLDSVMVGFKYILLKNSVAEHLKELEVDQVSFKPAVIWNRKSDTDDLSYMQMNVSHQFDSDGMNNLDLGGVKFLLMDNRYLFVTPELKARLEASNLNWSFSKGFSSFG